MLKTTANDTDIDAKLKYSIIEPIKAVSKTGISLTSIASYDYKTAFRIDPTNGTIYINNTLNHNLAAEVILTVQVIDENAAFHKEKQKAISEVTIFVQSFDDLNPIFKNKGWSSSTGTIKVTCKEEIPIGSVPIKLIAEDPVLEMPIEYFEIFQSDENNLFSVDEQTGAVTLMKRLDYEALNETEIEFSVKAISKNQNREAIAKIIIAVENVNDNVPEFEQKSYRAVVTENVEYPEKVLTVYAHDADAELTELDKQIGYSRVYYSLLGSNAVYFIIGNSTGAIQVAPNQIIDREKNSELKFTVIAEDAAGKPTDTRRSTADIIITVLDVNDNAPVFSQKSYSAVIPENAPQSTFIINVSASDPDEGAGGEVNYEWLNEGDATGLLYLNSKTGEIQTQRPLTGKGRSQPYELIIRAHDNGERTDKHKSLYSDVPFILYIGDVSANDGIPYFIAPQLGQIANITEVGFALTTDFLYSN